MAANHHKKTSPRKRQKRLTKEEINSWICEKCSNKSMLKNSYNLNTETLNESIEDLENNLIENNLFKDTENVNDRLQVAAKIGSSLLAENRSKKQNLRLETRLTVLV